MAELIWHWGGLASLVFAAAFLQAAIGFGFALLAVPILLVILNSTTAIQVAIIMMFVTSSAMAVRLARVTPRGPIGRFAAGALLGLPLGIFAYSNASLAGLKAAVGALTVLMAAMLIVHNIRKTADSHRFAGSRAIEVGAGILAGGLGAAIGVPGPPVILYLNAVQMPRDISRGTTLALFAMIYAGSILLQATVVGIAWETWRVALILIPIALIGSHFGNRAAKRLTDRSFRIVALSVLICAGLYTVATASW